MYLLDRKRFGSVSADIYVQNGKVSVYGKITDSTNKTSRPLPTLLDLCRIPLYLADEIKKRMLFEDRPTDKMSAELRKFCNKVWQKASEYNTLYGRK